MTTIRNNKLLCFSICTSSHIANALASLNSIKSNTIDKSIDYKIFVLDKINDFIINDIYLINLNSFIKDKSKLNLIYEKYGQMSNETRWTLKSFLLYETSKEYEKIIYIDPDIFFIDDIKFLFDQINDDILLTPHFRSIDNNNFDKCNMTDGYFNAGFIGISSKCKEIINWWFKCCLMDCSKNKLNGIYDDQKYLDLMYIHFTDNVSKLLHKGCNIAHWNILNYNISMINNKYLIDNKYDVIFFHFSSYNGGITSFFNGYYQLYKKLIIYYNNLIKNL